jgi:xylan 1,4-beta-xylosidase
MGKPDFPSRKQIAALQQAGKAAPPEMQIIQQGRLTLTVPPEGLVVVEIH